MTDSLIAISTHRLKQGKAADRRREVELEVHLSAKSNKRRTTSRAHQCVELHRSLEMVLTCKGQRLPEQPRKPLELSITHDEDLRIKPPTTRLISSYLMAYKLSYNCES